MVRKAEIISAFTLLKKQAIEEDGDDKNKYRAQSFAKAIQSLRKWPKSEIEKDDLVKIRLLPGIGKGMYVRIEDMVNGNVLKEIQEIRAEQERAEQERAEQEKKNAENDDLVLSDDSPDESHKNTLKLFQGIYGVGPVTALKWYNRGLRTLPQISELRELTDSQKIGLKYYSELKSRIPRLEIYAIEQQIQQLVDYLNTENSLAKDYKKIEFKIAGSYLRGNPDSGDIDIIVSSHGIDALMYLLREYGIVEYILAHGDTKILTVGGLAMSQFIQKEKRKDYLRRRIDFEIVQPEDWFYALLYFTGSKEFNTEMRGVAKSKGMLLNHIGLFKADGTVLGAGSEKDIFDHLGMEWVEPKDR